MEKNSKIYIAGHEGLAGSAIERKLREEGFENLILRKKSKLDLTDINKVSEFFNNENPEYVFMAAAKVGGIAANMNYPADFIYENTLMQANVINSSFKQGVKKLLNLGCCCAYPTNSKQPIKEEYLLTDVPEPTNEAFAIAKIFGIKTCQAYNNQYKTNFISVIPSNLYGPKDDFDKVNSHIVGKNIRLMYEAKEKGVEEIVFGGTGKPVRDLLYSDDLADACLFLMKNYNDSEIINIGNGEELSKKDIVFKVKDIVGYEGRIKFDTSKPDGMMKRILDTSKLSKMGWKAKTSVDEGLKRAYRWFLENKEESLR